MDAVSSSAKGRGPRVLVWIVAVIVILTLGGTTYFFAGTPNRKIPALETGDLIFQTSRGRLAKVIIAASRSKFTHVGFVVQTKKGPKVLEANGPVKMTALRRFINRGVGKRVVIKRVKGGLNSKQKRSLVRVGLRYRGVPYDARFMWSDKRMYCSELVWKVYERGPRISLARPQLMGELYSAHNPIIQAFTKRTYGKKLPLKEPIVTPKRLLDSALLVKVYDDTWF